MHAPRSPERGECHQKHRQYKEYIPAQHSDLNFHMCLAVLLYTRSDSFVHTHNFRL